MVCIVLAGCNEEQTADSSPKKLDVELVNTLNNIAVENAILTQHTLYPYHFGQEAAELNDLGQRDLAVLARYFKEHPGVLNINKGDAQNDLYDARVAHVLSQLQNSGVETARMSVSNGMPGGTGMPSESLVVILQKQGQAPASTGTSSSRMTAR
jgi:hypothetical protein